MGFLESNRHLFAYILSQGSEVVVTELYSSASLRLSSPSTFRCIVLAKCLAGTVYSKFLSQYCPLASLLLMEST